MDFATNDAGYTPVVSDNAFKEVLAQRFDLAVVNGGRMKPPSADTIYHAGTIVAMHTSGPNAGLFVPLDTANSSATDGSQTAIGVLLRGASVSASGLGSEVSVIMKGAVYADLCVSNVSGTPTAGFPAAAITALGGRKVLVHGQNEVIF